MNIDSYESRLLAFDKEILLPAIERMESGGQMLVGSELEPGVMFSLAGIESKSKESKNAISRLVWQCKEAFRASNCLCPADLETRVKAAWTAFCDSTEQALKQRQVLGILVSSRLYSTRAHLALHGLGHRLDTKYAMTVDDELHAVQLPSTAAFNGQVLSLPMEHIFGKHKGFGHLTQIDRERYLVPAQDTSSHGAMTHRVIDMAYMRDDERKDISRGALPSSCHVPTDTRNGVTCWTSPTITIMSYARDCKIGQPVVIKSRELEMQFDPTNGGTARVSIYEARAGIMADVTPGMLNYLKVFSDG